MTVVELCRKLEGDLGCRALSDISSAPSDIDIYVPPENMPITRSLVEKAGFVLTSYDQGQHVCRRFENGTLYILDLLSTFDVYTRYLTSLVLSAAGNRALGSSKTLHKSFKYLCFGGKERNQYIASHQMELAVFLENSSNFTWISQQLVAAARSPVNNLVKAARSIYLGRKFLSSLLRVCLLEPLRQRKARIGRGGAVAFIGPDGSGKTFFIEKFRLVGPTRNVYMGDWFFVFQRLYNYLMRIPSPCNRIVYALYPVENYVRMLKVLFHRLVGRIVLIDRFPGTNRNIIHEGVLGKLNQITFSIFPKPDLIVLLFAPPEVVYERKQELSIQEIGCMQDKLRIMLKNTQHLIVDTRNLDESLNIILAKTSERTCK